MAKATQILQIDPPNEITFKGPFTDVVSSSIKLTNPSDRQVCFKVKTTAPKQYCVRPNSGLIPAHGVVSVSVMLQPFDFNAEERNKHKFMVQTAYVPEGEQSLENIWKNTPANEMMDSKLRVNFEMPGEQNSLEKIVPTTKNPTTPSLKLGSSNMEADYRRSVDEGKRLQSQLQQMEKENVQLMDRINKLENARDSSSGGGRSATGQLNSNFTLMHVILAFIVALILGIISGKILF